MFAVVTGITTKNKVVFKIGKLGIESINGKISCMGWTSFSWLEDSRSFFAR